MSCGQGGRKVEPRSDRENAGGCTEPEESDNTVLPLPPRWRGQGQVGLGNLRPHCETAHVSLVFGEHVRQTQSSNGARATLSLSSPLKRVGTVREATGS